MEILPLQTPTFPYQQNGDEGATSSPRSKSIKPKEMTNAYQTEQ